MTALHWACKLGQFKLAKQLIDFKSDIDAEDLVGRRPLHFALINNHQDLVKLLLEKKANPWSTFSFDLSEYVQKDAAVDDLLQRAKKIDVIERIYFFMD